MLHANPLLVEVRTDRDRVIVVPVGDIDVGTSDDLRRQLAGLRHRGWAHLVLDLRQVTFLDSSGLRLLLEQRAVADAPGRSFAIVAGTRAATRALEVSGLTKLFAYAQV